MQGKCPSGNAFTEIHECAVEGTPRSPMTWWVCRLCGQREPRGNQLRDELLAIEALVAAHPDEFKQAVVDIRSRREWIERKAKNERAQ